MSSPSPIPPPNDRRNSRASNSEAGLQDPSFPVGGPPSSPSPLALRASNSPSSKHRKSRGIAKIPPDAHQLEYVSACDSNLICLICHSPFDKPVRLACDHYFCRTCLDHCWAAQHDHLKTCPTCRNKVDTDKEPLSAPKILDSMLEELTVKCPHAKLGCHWVGQRGNVHDHVMLYCEYSLVECPSFDCRLPISQKDFHKGCLHYTVSCDDCHTSLLKKDLEDHQRNTCSHRITACPHCSIDLVRLDLKTHVEDVCTKVVVPCQGTMVGCTFMVERGEVAKHEKQCPMAVMAPHFRHQQARIEASEARLEPLARKVGILEDGLSNITNMLYPANANDSSFPVTHPLDVNTSDSFASVPTPDFRLPPASFPPVPPTNTELPSHTTLFNNNNNNNQPSPPFDSQIHHLLSLHESLRDEVSRIANALNEHEGRTSMMIMNENQRVKEDMLHANSAINAMRVQLHWLMSATLSQRNSARAGTGNTTASASSSTQSANSGLGAGGRPGAVGGTLYHAPFRRLSDSTRQDTKL